VIIYLHTRNYAPHTVDKYGRELRVFCTPLAKEPREVAWRDIEAFIQPPPQARRTATTINRRLHALKHFFASLVMEQQTLAMHPVKPSHCLRRGRPLPQQRSQDQVRTLFAQIGPPWDHALCWLMLRCGLRVSEVARLRLHDLDWTQPSLRVDHGKGRQDRIGSGSAAVLAALRPCLPARPAGVPDGVVCWNQQRPHRPLSPQGMQKKMERYAQAAGIKASCHRLRHPFASHLLEAGAEVIASTALLGHASSASSER
jgi:integrase/recombinase XerC